MRSAMTALPTWRKDGSVNAVIEAPRGCGVKIAYDAESDCFEYGKALPLGITYPYCFGFIPGTAGDDGDPLDVLVLTDAPTYPGVVVPARLIGVVRLSENGKKGKRQRNDRLVGVPTAEPRIADGVESPEDLCGRLREEIEQFFLNTTLFTQKEPRIEGWKGPTAAQKLIRRSVRQR